MNAKQQNSKTPEHSGGPAIPAGLYRQLDVDLIDDGKFRSQIDQALERGLRDLNEWEQATNKNDGTFTITAKITVGRMADTSEHYTVKSGVHLNTPTITSISMVKGAGGLLLCQPDGAGQGDPDQIRLFDNQGRPKATVDPVTGEYAKESAGDVAGKLNGTEH